jgi:hypothetical protein
MTRARGIAAIIFVMAAAAAMIWTAVLITTGGVNTSILGLRISSNNAWRPFGAALAAAALAVGVAGLARTRRAVAAAATAATPARAAGLLAVATLAVSLGGNSWTASGPDSYAYVSQAELWREGRLELPVPLAADVPWPNAVATFAKPGYRPAPDGRPALVPVTAPGLPLLMAAFQTVGGHAAAFVITPLAGAALVLFTFLIGRRIDTPRSGLIAAWLVATSPAVLYMLMWPMTDIPTAAIAALMIWCLCRPPTTGAAAAAGIAAAAGLLVRPNFSLIAAAAWAWLLIDALRSDRTRPGWARLIAFTVAAVPGEIAVMAVSARWYGSPLASGYGSLGGLLALDRVTANLEHYVRWLVETSPLGVAGLVALALPARKLWTTTESRRAWLLLFLTTAAAWSVYLLYGEFQDWWYLRFLLPAWPAMFVAAALVVDRIWARSIAGRLIAIAVLIATGIHGLATARERWVFNLGHTERRYAAVARIVDEHTEPDAVILTSQHAGTIRYYARRETLRFDFLDPAWLDRAVAWLAAEGRHPYVLVEDWEQPLLEARFPESELATLSFPPVLTWHSKYTPGDVRLYDPFRRDGSTVDPGPAIEDSLPRSAAPIARRQAF